MLPVKNGSLFRKFWTVFTLVILLLAVILLLVFGVFLNYYRSENVKYNELSIATTANHFENQFRLIEKVLLRLYFNGSVDRLKRDSPIDYETVGQVAGEIRGLMSNELPYVDNIFLVSASQSFVVEKDGLSSLDDMFTKYYTSPDYRVPFWEEQFQLPYHFRVLPASDFSRIRYDREVLPIGQLLPVIVKNEFNKSFYIVAMIDIARMIDDYRLSYSDDFYLLDGEGRRLWGLGELFAAESGAVDWLSAGSGLFSETYTTYYYKTGDMSGLRYVNVLSNSRLHAQVNQLLLYAVSFVVLFALAAFLLLVRFSRSVNRPLQNIVQAVQKLDPSDAAPSGIQEFEIINEQLGRLLRMNREITSDLDQKNALLKNVDYLYKVKNIHSGVRAFADGDADLPFVFALFHLQFRPGFERHIDMPKEKATYVVKELIQLHMADHHPRSVTVQVEHNVIMTLLYCEGEAVPDPRLGWLAGMLDHDSDLCVVTIACANRLWDPGEWNTAYLKHTNMLQYRTLEPSAQIVSDLPAEAVPATYMSAAQEKQLQSFVQAGNEAAVIPLVMNIAEALHRRGAPVAFFHGFAGEVIGLAMKELISLQVDVYPQLTESSPYARIRECSSLPEFQSGLREFLQAGLKLIRDKRELKDDVIAYVLQYIGEHYAADISLEQVADKLGLSRNYFSTYFKEKTGHTFSEYVNDLRIGQAKKMLLDGKHKVHDIAVMVGYQNTNSFIRMFRKKLGIPPGEYRKSQILGERE